MPAQIYITKEQIAQIHEEDEDVIVCEGPMTLGQGERGTIIDVWVMDEEHQFENTHRSIVLSQDGEVLRDAEVSDTGE